MCTLQIHAIDECDENKRKTTKNVGAILSRFQQKKFDAKLKMNKLKAKMNAIDLG